MRASTAPTINSAAEFKLAYRRRGTMRPPVSFRNTAWSPIFTLLPHLHLEAKKITLAVGDKNDDIYSSLLDRIYKKSSKSIKHVFEAATCRTHSNRPNNLAGLINEPCYLRFSHPRTSVNLNMKTGAFQDFPYFLPQLTPSR
jgi:hypothetical protein